MKETEGAASPREHKGAMRLPVPLHGRLMELSELTGRSLNDLIIEAGTFLCDLADHDKGAPLPKSVITARALRAHATRPVILHLRNLSYEELEPPEPTSKVAETPPPSRAAQARRASGR